jgi:hypothetical protein
MQIKMHLLRTARANFFSVVEKKREKERRQRAILELKKVLPVVLTSCFPGTREL